MIRYVYKVDDDSNGLQLRHKEMSSFGTLHTYVGKYCKIDNVCRQIIGIWAYRSQFKSEMCLSEPCKLLLG